MDTTLSKASSQECVTYPSFSTETEYFSNPWASYSLHQKEKDEKKKEKTEEKNGSSGNEGSAGFEKGKWRVRKLDRCNTENY